MVRTCAQLLILSGALGCGTPTAQTPPRVAAPAPAAPAPADPWIGARSEAETWLAQLHATERMPGVQAAVLVAGSVVWQGTRGVAADGTPLTATTPLALASVSKVATAMLLARALAAGQVQLDAAVSTYVPAWPDHGTPVTVRQLAGHLGGVRHYTFADYGRDRRYDRLADAVTDIFASDPRVADPGARYAYSSWGYTLLGAVLEAATQTAFPALLERELSTPARLTLAVDPAASARYPGGGLRGTATDLVRLGHLLSASAGYVPAPILTTLLTSQVAADGTPTGVGLGWRVGADASGRRIAHHAGNLADARTVVMTYVDLDVVVALMSNQMNAPAAIEQAAEQLAAPFLATVASTTRP